jgi:DNA-binding response OmpR family regulator
MPHLLIVEDDDLLRDGLSAQLARAGHTVMVAPDGEAAQQILLATRFDGVVLDLGMPKVDGTEVLRWIRSRLGALPVLVLTARDGVEDRVQGLEAGADDYLTKPFSLPELQARITAMLRRAQLPAYGGTQEIFAPNTLNAQAGASSRATKLRVDPLLPRVWLDAQPVDLTQREWALISLLVGNAGQVVSREDVMLRWAEDTSNGSPADAADATPEVGSNALEVYVHRLRRKLADSGLVIRNVRGLGYLLEVPAPR